MHATKMLSWLWPCSISIGFSAHIRGNGVVGLSSLSLLLINTTAAVIPLCTSSVFKISRLHTVMFMV